MTLRRLPRALSPLLLTLLTAHFGIAHAAERDGLRDEIARQDLALIQDQLAQIQRIVDRLEGRVGEFDPYTTRVFLDVPRLRRDLEAVAEGIDDVLEPPAGAVLMEAFAAGAGFEAPPLGILIAGVGCTVVLLWACWSAISSYRGYAKGRVSGDDFGFAALRAVFLVVVMFWIFL